MPATCALTLPCCSRASAGSVKLLDDSLRWGISTLFADYQAGQPSAAATGSVLAPEYPPEALAALVQVRARGPARSLKTQSILHGLPRCGHLAQQTDQSLLACWPAASSSYQQRAGTRVPSRGS